MQKVEKNASSIFDYSTIKLEINTESENQKTISLKVKSKQNNRKKKHSTHGSKRNIKTEIVGFLENNVNENDIRQMCYS